MGKSSRASTIKQNNRKLKSNVFGPVEAARNERLHAKLAELVAAPKPVKEVEMAEGMSFRNSVWMSRFLTEF